MCVGVLMVPGSRIRLNELSSPGLTALPIPKHNGGLVCILLKAMSLGKVLVQLGGLVIAREGLQGLND